MERIQAHLKFLQQHLESNRVFEYCNLHSWHTLNFGRRECTFCLKLEDIRRISIESQVGALGCSSYTADTVQRYGTFALPYSLCHSCRPLFASVVRRHYDEREAAVWAVHEAVSLEPLASIIYQYLYFAKPSCPLCLF